MTKRIPKKKIATLSKLSEIIATQAQHGFAKAKARSNTIANEVKGLRELKRSLAKGSPYGGAMSNVDKAMRAKERLLLQDQALAEVARLEAKSAARRAEQKRLVIEALIRQAS